MWKVIIVPAERHKNPHYALRIPEDLMDKLKYVAEYNGRSANREIEQLIRVHIARFEQKHGQIELTPEDYAFIRKRTNSLSRNKDEKKETAG